MNDWTLTGTVTHFKHKVYEGKSWSSLWIRVLLPEISTSIPNRQFGKNSLRIDVNLDEKKSNRLLDVISVGSSFLFEGAKMVPCTRSKLVDQSWQNYMETGIKCSQFGIYKLSSVPTDINFGKVLGKIVAFEGNTLVVSESYRDISTNKYKTRNIPFLVADNVIVVDNPVGRQCLIFAQAYGGANKAGEYKVVGITKRIVMI